MVTPVKFQNPWGSCWAFGGIAAAESSILTTMGLTAEEFKAEYGEDFNLSEKHLVWYALHPVTDATDDSQAGEGMYIFKGETDPNAAFDAGGKPIYITTLFSSGVGPVFEDSFPYRGAEGTTELEFSQNDPDGARKALKEYKEEELEMTLEDGEFLGKRVAYHEYAGFHRLPLRGDLTIKNGDRIAVVVEESVVNKDGNKVYQYTVNAGLGKPLADELGLPFYGKAIVNHGESYLYENGKWTDLADHKLTYSDALKESFEEEEITVVNNDNVNDMLAVDNFSIKMYVTE